MSFRFPKLKEVREQWVQVCKIDEQDITPDTIICSQHFKVEDFDESSWPKRKLLAGVIPSPSIPCQAQKKHYASQSIEKQVTQDRMFVFFFIWCTYFNLIQTFVSD